MIEQIKSKNKIITLKIKGELVINKKNNGKYYVVHFNPDKSLDIGCFILGNYVILPKEIMELFRKKIVKM